VEISNPKTPGEAPVFIEEIARTSSILVMGSPNMELYYSDNYA
jgi:hypothetical protein